MEPLWLEVPFALIVHAEQLAEHGGLEGVRDPGGLESALARPRNMWAYSNNEVGLARLAGAYANGIVCNHPFVDGNKRTALVVSFTFLKVNGFVVSAELSERYLMFDGLAAGRISEEEFVSWLERSIEPTRKPPQSTL